MTLRELKQRVDFACENARDLDDIIVCIPNNKPSMGPISVTEVKSAGKGIDWDKSKFIIWPEAEMIEKTK
jgi:hypothetical protein